MMTFYPFKIQKHFYSGGFYCGYSKLWLFYILPSFSPPILFAPVFLSSEVKEAVMEEPEKVPESSEEVRAPRSAGLTQLYHSPHILHIKRQTTFYKWLSSFPLYFSIQMHYYYRYMQALLIVYMYIS